MKRKSILIITILHILCLISLVLISIPYVFMAPALNLWLGYFLVLIFILLTNNFGNNSIHPYIGGIFILMLTLIMTLSIYDLPQFTYLQASEIIEAENGEVVITPPKGAIKGQLGTYFIYTEENVYLFDAGKGEYGKRSPLE